MITLQIHIANGEPIKLDVEEMPSMTDIAIVGSNPRDRQERDVNWIDDGVSTVIIPWSRIKERSRSVENCPRVPIPILSIKWPVSWANVMCLWSPSGFMNMVLNSILHLPLFKGSLYSPI